MADTLTNQHRQFVVERLAAFDSATEVANALLEQFGITVAPHVVAVYDPTERAGQHCPAHWKRRFLDARRAIIQGAPPAIASRAVRLRKRQQMFARAYEQGDFLLANRILNSIAREVGDDTSGFEKQVELTDEERAHRIADLIYKMRRKREAERPTTPEEAEKWDRDPVGQFIAIYGPSRKARGRRNQPVKRSEE